MRHSYVTALAIAALSIGPVQHAFAADMAVKAAPPVNNTWTGIYVGINGGYSLGRYPTSVTNTDPDPGASSGITSPQGGVFGGQVGYNWQLAPLWLVGVEGDLQWVGSKDTQCFGECGTPGAGGDDQLQVEARLKWLGTARARFGYLHNDYLWYVTGGAAFGGVSVSATGFDLDVTAAPVGTIRSNQTKVGYAIGGGVETKILQNMSAKLEYLYVDLGSVSTSGLVAINGSPTQVSSATIGVKDHIIRLGLNWKL